MFSFTLKIMNNFLGGFFKVLFWTTKFMWNNKGLIGKKHLLNYLQEESAKFQIKIGFRKLTGS